MHREIAGVIVAVSLSLVACTGPAGPEDSTPEPEPKNAAPKQARNPFGLEDLADDFFGEELQEWASGVELGGGPDDPNSEAWPAPSAQREFDSIDGEWAGRWSESQKDDKAWMTGTATIKSVGDRVFFLYRSEGNEDEYLCEALREGNRLVGSYVNIDPFMWDDNGPWVGLIVGSDRIDGKWLDGRWDLRRVAAEVR